VAPPPPPAPRCASVTFDEQQAATLSLEGILQADTSMHPGRGIMLNHCALHLDQPRCFRLVNADGTGEESDETDVGVVGKKSPCSQATVDKRVRITGKPMRGAQNAYVPWSVVVVTDQVDVLRPESDNPYAAQPAPPTPTVKPANGDNPY
jgi:hypothetical protein